MICPECQAEIPYSSIFCNKCGQKLGTCRNVYLQIVQGEGDFSLSVMLKNLGFLIKNVPFASRKAEAHFNKAILVAEEIGAIGLMGQAHLGLGMLHKAKKRKDKARECLLKAVDCFDRCEAETILKQTREELDSLC